ncbi:MULTISPECIES: hypothetical protein [Cyanophyceae]|uniref:hypothetical protein n=1 Tax=Cyanophyceae TaxID=3028117 RepID=UPI001688206E|nr:MULTISPECIES: hypothetical protein [Cyanophyceae]MBD1916516.1 hypothetical protein [Phormidium sp. FACHB-77]MBD2032083.1 hypothetical protein [Phormidium sp. FACHB-322]MBD2052963.1 hypothetical protein [Leptolyngbya sp. FACHB-60]
MSLTDTDLSPNQDFFNEEEAVVEFTPNESFFSSNSVLTLLAAFDSSFAELVADFASALPDATGQISVEDGLFDANLRLADGTTLTGTFDAPTTLRGFADLAAVSNGTVTLNGGMMEAAIATDGQTAVLPRFDLTAAVSTLVLDTINAIDDTVPFANGAFTLDLATALGPIGGTVDLAGGDLNLDLATPFGQLVADIDFQDDAVFPFSASLPLVGDINGVVDFNSGNIVAPLGVFGDLSIPLSAVTGSLTLADGLASLDASLPIGSGLSLPVATADLAIGPLASEYVAEFVQDLDGTGTLTDGVLDAAIESSLGLFETTFDVVAFTNQGADFFAGIDGVIDVSGGIATASLTTPLGAIDDSFDLATVAPALEAPVTGSI